jgi:hypothetical protein
MKPVMEPASPTTRIRFDHDDPRHHVLGHRPPHAPIDLHLRAVDEADAEVAEAALEGDPAAGEDADAERVPGRRIENGYFLYALLVDQPSQFSIDLASREVLGVELRALSVYFGDVRDLVVELDEAAGIEEDLVGGVAAVGGYRVHTITAPSYGS